MAAIPWMCYDTGTWYVSILFASRCYSRQANGSEWLEVWPLLPNFNISKARRKTDLTGRSCCTGPRETAETQLNKLKEETLGKWCGNCWKLWKNMETVTLLEKDDNREGWWLGSLTQDQSGPHLRFSRASPARPQAECPWMPCQSPNRGKSWLVHLVN